MIRRPLSHPTPCYRGLSVLLLLLLLVVGCATTDGTKPSTGQQVTTPPITPQVLASSPAAVPSLKKAQDLFNEAVKSDQPTAVNVPAASRQKYQQVVDTVEKEVLGRADASVNVSAYALLAFSQWRLDNFGKAMEAGEKGRRLFETAKLATNRRDYGMCLIVGGLCTASQAYKDYHSLQTSPTQEVAQNLTGRLEQAMRTLDSGNTYLDKQEPIAVYANLWQLALVDSAVRIWTSGLPPEVSQPEVCRWLSRAEPVFAKFPETGNPWQSITLDYKKKFEKKKQAECQGR
jgi:hypothetical protein